MFFPGLAVSKQHFSSFAGASHLSTEVRLSFHLADQ